LTIFLASSCQSFGGLNHAPLIPAGFQSFLRNPAESRGIKIGPEPSQNDILGDEYSGGMVSFLISSRNGPRNGQKGMHQERNDRNTHYLLLLLINFSEQSYYSKQLIVHGQIEHRQTPTLDLVSSTINNPSLPTTTIIDNPASPPSPTATTSHDRQYPLPSVLTTVTDCPSP